MGIKERRERERQARRSLVLDATRELVRERGFTGTTTRQIAKKCELSEATLFFYFKSKDEILTSLLFEGIALMRTGLDEISAAELSGPERVARLWGFFTRVRQEHPEYLQVFAMLAQPRGTGSVSDEVREEIARCSGENLRSFAAILAETVGPERARVAADLVWGAFAGLAVLRDSRLNLETPLHPDANDLEVAFDLLLNGLLPRGDDP